jgi:hypothetical protein
MRIRIFFISAALGLVGCAQSPLKWPVQAQSSPPVIVSAQVNSSAGQLSITGSSFGAAADRATRVYVSDDSQQHTNTMIVTLPANLNPGTYGLPVSNPATSQTGSFVVAIGAAGPPGPQGPEGVQGPIGLTGPAGPVGPDIRQFRRVG